MNRRHNKKIWLYGFFTILIGVVIFCFSAQPANESDKASGFIVELIQAVFGDGVFGESLHFLVRKAAHVTVYFLFGLNSTQFWKSCLMSGERKNMDKRSVRIDSLLLGLLVSFLYACSDEWHQTFVDGRSGSLLDVLIDGIGFVPAAILASLAK